MVLGRTGAYILAGWRWKNKLYKILGFVGPLPHMQSYSQDRI